MNKEEMQRRFNIGRETIVEALKQTTEEQLPEVSMLMSTMHECAERRCSIGQTNVQFVENLYKMRDAIDCGTNSKIDEHGINACILRPDKEEDAVISGVGLMESGQLYVQVSPCKQFEFTPFDDVMSNTEKLMKRDEVVLNEYPYGEIKDSHNIIIAGWQMNCYKAESLNRHVHVYRMVCLVPHDFYDPVSAALRMVNFGNEHDSKSSTSDLSW